MALLSCCRDTASNPAETFRAIRSAETTTELLEYIYYPVVTIQVLRDVGPNAGATLPATFNFG
jgi:hypothetical protein